MEWKIKPITEEEISNFFSNLWPLISDTEKNYLREMHMTICVSNAKWRTDLELIVKEAEKRKELPKKVVTKQSFDEPEETNEEVEEEQDDGVGEVDIEEAEPKFKMNKRVQ